MISYRDIYRMWWFRPTVTVAVLATVAALSLMTVRTNPYNVVVVASIPLLLFGLELTVRRLYWIPMIILLIATATDWYISKGITPALILTGAFAAVWFLRQLVVSHRIEFVKSPVIAPSITFILVAVLSLIWGQIAADPFLIPWVGIELIILSQLAVIVLSPVALILTASLLRKVLHLQFLVYGFLGFAALGLLADLVNLPFGLNMRGLSRAWVVALLYGQLLFNRNLPRWLRFAFVSLIGVWVYIDFFKGISWLSGWVPGMVAMGVITFLKSKKWFVWLLVFVVVIQLVFNVYSSDQLSAEYDESGGNRLAKWEFLFQHPFMYQDWHWVLGTGPFGYARYFMTYFPENATSTHSNYIDIYLQMGVVGVAALIWLMSTLAWVGFKLRTIPIEDLFIVGFVHSVLGGLVGVLVAMFLGDWFIPFVLNQGLHGFSWTINSWIFFGALTAVPTILQRDSKQMIKKDI